MPDRLLTRSRSPLMATEALALPRLVGRWFLNATSHVGRVSMLVVDLVRLVLLAQRRNESGVLRHLACFFKSPLGVNEHDFGRQFEMLEQYTRIQD